ncbi:UNKNOWN [Stylonychia lemnae]|uniref:Uncharacterized protein n=1 Tax=Stylonychia lemnae TaxID=5949 RepID=A0A078B1T9_STYLE|nr:UNKNOWN [Stylonychia lemnae]|eukprot:CDW87268.1 UNKNOWN [Stylonychia lemnae]
MALALRDHHHTKSHNKTHDKLKTIFDSLGSTDQDLNQQSNPESMKMEVAKFKGQMRRQEIEYNLNVALLEGIFSKKEYDVKMKLVEENKELINRSVLNPEEDKLIEQRLGLVTQVREVQNLAQQSNQKIDKEEFVTEIFQVNFQIQQKGLKDAQLLIKRLNEDKKEREQKKLIQQKLEQEKRKKGEDEIMRKQEEEMFKKEEEKRKKQEEIEKKFQDKHQERQKYREDSQVKIKTVINSKPLYKQYEEKYIQEIEMPQLEMKKKQLEELRNLHKPIQKQDLLEHAMKYERMKQQQLEDIKKHRDLSIQAEKDRTANLRYKIKESLNLSVIDPKKIEDEKILEERKKYTDKVRNYAKQVKEMYWPKVSETKQLELEQRIDQLRSQNIRRSVNDLTGDGKNTNRRSGRGTASATQDDETASQIEKKVIDWKKLINPMAPQQKHPKLDDSVYKSMDFLRELRAKREQDEKDGIAPRRVNDLQKIEKMLANPNISDNEKMDYVKKRAELIEKQALRDEMLIRAGHVDNIEKNIAVNDKYIDAITAKLKILDQI